LIAKPPTSIRETLEFLQFYRKEVGLQPLLDAAQEKEWTPRQIYFAVHGRPPDSLDTVLNIKEHKIHNLLIAALYSDEFRQQHPVNILRGFPEKQRVFFVHVPRTVGPDLDNHLTSRYPTLNTRLSQADRVSPEEFLLSLKHFALEVAQSDTIFITGNNRLSTYAGWNVLRLEDRVFSVLCDPVKQVISQLNHVLTRIFSEKSPAAPDTLGWRHEFGVDHSIREPSPELVRDLAHRVLRHPGVVNRNVACHYLGNGTYESALECVAIHNVELVDSSTYATWCREQWNIERFHHADESKNYLSASDLSAPDMEYLIEQTREDGLLHNQLTAALRATGESAVTGVALARGFAAVPTVETPKAAAVSAPIDPPRPDLPLPDLPLPDLPLPDLPLNELMLEFESLGENCEFGLVQRRCGAEPLGLLRFASAPLPKLLRALQNRFEGMGRPENVEVQVSGNGREYMVLDKVYGFLYHAWVLVGEKTAEEVAAREVKRVPFLIRKLIEDLEGGHKIFVYHSMSEVEPGDIQELASAIRKYGTSTLLWVNLADTENAVGSVKCEADGLLIGHVDRFAPGEDAHDLSLDAWTAMCKNAWDPKPIMPAVPEQISHPPRLILPPGVPSILG
jgi:hypothetical protein